MPVTIPVKYYKRLNAIEDAAIKVVKQRDNNIQYGYEMKLGLHLEVAIINLKQLLEAGDEY